MRAWKLFLSLDRMLFHTSDAKRTNNTSLTKAIRTHIAQIEAGNALEILRQSQQTYVPQRTMKPRTDPTDATDKHNRRTIQLIKSAVEDGDGRRAGKLVKGISGMAPAADVKRNWSKLYPEPKTQTGNSETLPFTEEDRQSFLCQLLLAIKFSPSNRTTGPGGGRCEHWTWMTEFNGDPCDCVWEAFWRLATDDVPTEILGTYLAARIVPATKPNGGVRPFAIGQVIRRLVCKATAKLLTKKVRSNTSPHQFAVGMKQGPELLHKIVSAHVAIHRDAAMASVDVKNAHGAVEWGAIQSEIEALDRNVCKWCAVLFKAGHELTCKLDNGDIITHTMRRGLAQGCPMSSLIFPLTVHRTVSIVENQMRNADPNARVNICQDDLTLNGNADPLAGGLTLLQKKLSPLGLELNKHKSTIWTNPNGLSHNSNVVERTGMKRADAPIIFHLNSNIDDATSDTATTATLPLDPERPFHNETEKN